MSVVGELMTVGSVIAALYTTLQILQEVQDRLDDADSTLEMIRAQIDILITNIQSIQTWIDSSAAETMNKTNIQSNLEKALDVVASVVVRLQTDLHIITARPTGMMSNMGRNMTARWMKAKYLFNEDTMRRHLTDVRECVALVHFTLTVAQL